MSVLRKFNLSQCFFILAVIVTFGFLSLANSALAQSSGIAVEMQPLIEKAQKDGMSIIILSPTPKASQMEADTGMKMQERSLKVRNEVKRIIGNSKSAWQEMQVTLKKASPDGTWWWLAKAIGIAVFGMLVSGFVGYLFRRRYQDRMKEYYKRIPENRAEKIEGLLLRAGVIFINIAIMFVVASIIALILDYDHEPSRATIFIIITSYMSYWVLRAVIFFNIIAPDLPNHRMINIKDKDAWAFQKDWRNSMAVVIVALSFCAWMDALGLNKDVHKLFLVSAMLLAVIIFATMILRNKHAISDIILGAGEPASKPVWRRIFSQVAPFVGIGYLTIAWIVSSVRTILDWPSADILVAAPIISFVVSLAVYGLVLLIIDRIYLARKTRFEERVELAHRVEVEKHELEQAALQQAMENRPEDDEEIIINQVMSTTEIGEMPVFKPVFKSLLETATGAFIIIAAIGFVLGTWDVNIGEKGNPVTAFMDTLAIAFFAWFLYRAVAAYIDAQMEDEDVGPDEEEEPSGEMPAHGATRHATLLPLIRNVVVTTIVILTSMVLLSNMGVDIAPLFAGAGVIGLAVGFGAQTLIRDIFSGGFFLFDDAFRKGEYIELDNIRGTVEKISLRSFQLRHHNGPLHTVPFGEIKQLTNYSRDWVMMKLPLRVTYDTDVERVRKLVKKLGQKLLENEEIGDMFLQPLKSQGVYKMEDSAMIIRVKFMAKPGDQFIMRKHVYAEIRDLFEREGIKFAHKEVTVRIAEEPTRKLDDIAKTAIAAGAAQAVTEEQPLPGKVDDGP
ncbi:MAG: mechanosensitive ion channel family protein [Rhizobiaceae bacterium]|nr:mechanosensitive ion channel family protein [Rhizobiaceae bacterium]